MTAKERVKIALSHREPDRVPIFEVAFDNKLASKILGKQVYIHNGASTYKKAIECNMLEREVRKEYIKEGALANVDLYTNLGYDIIAPSVTEFLAPVNCNFGIFGTNYIFDTKTKPIERNVWRISSTEGFWSLHKYSEESDTLSTIANSISEGGVTHFRKYIDYISSLDTNLNDWTRDGLDTMKIVLESEPVRNGELFVLGRAEICFPAFEPHLELFLETMITEPKLIDRYMEVTTEGVLTLLRAQLDMGVDGILGANDWCDNNGPFFSPSMFDRFFVPHMKRIVDECHKYGVPFIKHLDGNVTKLLPSLVNNVGIDGLHPNEPKAGMEIGNLKGEYGDKITLLGNLDCADLLVNGTQEMIVDAVKDIIKKASKGGGHIFSSSNSIHGGIPLRNVQTMIDAVKEFGEYPIR